MRRRAYHRRGQRPHAARHFPGIDRHPKVGRFEITVAIIHQTQFRSEAVQPSAAAQRAVADLPKARGRVAGRQGVVAGREHVREHPALADEHRQAAEGLAQAVARIDERPKARLPAGGGEARFRALVDTGNRLREPFSGLPVLICERGVLADVLPAGYDALPPGGAPPGFRQVGYGALGGGGRMNCFRPELCLVDYGNGYLKSPDLWVAVYPGKMPGGVRALAPPVVGAAQPPSRRAAARTTG